MATKLNGHADSLDLDPNVARAAEAVRNGLAVQKPPKPGLGGGNVKPVSKAIAKTILREYDRLEALDNERWTTTDKKFPDDADGCEIDGDVWFTTRSGRKVSLLDPKPESIDFEDIAFSLSRLCRFNGHLKHWFSVAEHCCLVSRLVPPRLALTGLLHDAAEAYCGDIVTPIKRLMSDAGQLVYQAVEGRLWRAIAGKFGVDPNWLSEVKEADCIACATERRDLTVYHADYYGVPNVEPHPEPIRPCRMPSLAHRQFAQRFEEITEKRRQCVA
jgi:uncharacterized protein